MYGLIWRALPGPALVKAFLALVLIAAAVLALFEWGFPAIAPYLPFEQQTVGGE